MRALRTLAVACLAAGALTACSSSGSGGGSTEAKGGSSASASAEGAGAGKGGTKLAPKEALLASAVVMEKAGSAKLSLEGVDVKGSIDYVWKDPGSFLMNTTEEGQEVKVLFADGQMYVGATPDMAAAAKGRKWMVIDASDSSDEAASITATMQAMNPGVQLAAAAPTATLVGTETVAGQSTTHYRSEIKAEDLVAKMKIEGALKDQVLTEIKKDGATVVTELWINGKGELVQQSVIDPSADAGGKPATVTYGGLGTVKVTPAPGPDEVFKLGDLLQQ
ncbi:hypothetical protein HUT16_13935 [Kitasatospora sp. NA04385]|uniref:hypothetical protein n=1 Tax=Kitasatospora sp. NA04385 TaxID=2742135 RepID=UPI00159150B0|nr:hypothetical protein [Kitasatospora sp. NA04385]QKW20022.1 hypothetical protein HUT16_13935 [Kitasatospora sp. NA04385]